MREVQLVLKRILDFLFAFCVLLILSPVFLLVSVLIAVTSPGPVFFLQNRLGLKGKVYKIYKFRTMGDKAPDVRNADGSTFTGSNDPRITGIGRLLRKTSLDELPQLINVLIGNMSVVGPRPDLDSQLELYEPGELRKLDMKPGMTGWAMVLGRNNLSWAKRKELDVYYVDHFNLWFDLMIFLRTFPAVVFGVGVMTEGQGDRA